MKQLKTIWAAPVLAALLAACQAESPSKDLEIGTPVTEDYQSPADVPYLHDKEGNVLRNLPVVVLNDVRTQLLAQGKTAIAKNIEARYDFLTGEVKDPRAADRAEQYLKSQATKQPLVAPETPATGTKVLNPDELPAAIKIPDDMVQNLRNAAAKGGAK